MMIALFKQAGSASLLICFSSNITSRLVECLYNEYPYVLIDSLAASNIKTLLKFAQVIAPASSE